MTQDETTHSSEQAGPEVRPQGGTTPGSGAVELAHALFDLAREGDTDRLGAYVDAGAPANLTDPVGNTLVMLAAYHGHAATVRMLAERGADVDRLNDRGQSPLAGAVFKGDDAVIDILIGLGADPDVGTPTARQTAEMFGRSWLFGTSVGDAPDGDAPGSDAPGGGTPGGGTPGGDAPGGGTPDAGTAQDQPKG